ncbi:hypothetical protein GCM10010387_67090 [Streptomyces inusitatus]|uniref:Uncharacterized protein n=1 Tax=Streptomyces inusitatus TaxID=68221 RepID=A0A918QQV9_9ACTN|nr:hypothetical protein GCM10010387_67090 [Streptomyces inusitatus]
MTVTVTVHPLPRPGTALLRGMRAPAPPKPERCAFCGIRLAPGHRHLADTAERALVCACTACALLLNRPGAAGDRYRGVPDRCLTDPRHQVAEAAWATLGIPVSTAFLLFNSALDAPVLCYPGPAGATESELAATAWRTVFGDSRLAAALEPDVEALLLRRTRERVQCFLVPIDLCYELVGRMRLRWRGFDGGAEAHAELDAFFAAVADRARTLPEEILR